MSRVVSVAVPVPALTLLSYEVPEELPLPQIGARAWSTNRDITLPDSKD